MQAELDFLNYNATVTTDAINMARKLTKTGVKCHFDTSQLPNPGQPTDLRGLRQISKMLGHCVSMYAYSQHDPEKPPEEVTSTTVLEALASDHHLLATSENIEAYKAPYGLRTQQDQQHFLLSDLTTEGTIQEDGLHHPNPQQVAQGQGHIIELREDQITQEYIGSRAITHLNQVVVKNASQELIDRLHQVHQSQPRVRELLESTRGQRIRAFTPVPRQQP